MHSLNNLWLADMAFLNRALARWAEIKAEIDKRGGPHAETASPTQVERKADIVISGLLLPTVPKFFGISLRDWGLDVTGYDEIEQQVKAAANSKSPSVSMWVSSGGGAVQGIDRALDALRALANDKPIIAHVENMSASAAYWLTTTAKEIKANRLAEIGGVGVYVGLYNNPDQKTIVVRSGEFKGAGIDGFTEAQLEAIQERVDDVADQFFADVSASRATVDIDEIKTGRTWGARKALAKGLIDAIVNASETSGAEPVTAESSAEGENQMGEKERLEMERLRAENEALKKQIKAAEDEEEEAVPAEETEKVEPDPVENEDPAPEEEEDSAEGEDEEDKVEQARKEVAAVRAELKEMRKIMARNNGEDALENTGGAPSASKPTNWTEALAHIAKRDGVGMAEAGRKASKEFPDLHPAARR